MWRLALTLLLLGATLPMPPDPTLVRSTSCTASQVGEQQYEARATATYRDGREPWKALIGVHRDMRHAAADCVDWTEQVDRLGKRKGK